MGSVKLEQTSKIEENEGKGNETKEIARQKLEEAETSENAISIEGVDDDDREAIDEARDEMAGIAEQQAESEAREPAREIGESLKEVTEQSNEFAETEEQDAETASGAEGDYSEVGDKLSGDIQRSGQEFREIAERSDQDRKSVV